MSVTLRPYQQEAIVNLRVAMRRARRVMLASPTGSGKRIMFAWLAQAAAGHGARLLILKHRQEIIDQISAALTAFGLAHGIIAAGRPSADAAVQIASVMTLIRRIGQYGLFDLIIVDKAHHAAGASWRAILGAFVDVRILGVSATPERLDGRGLDDLFDELVMGPSVKELVDLGFLSPAVTFAPPSPPDLRGVKTRAGDFAQDALAIRMSDRVLVGNAVEHYNRLAPRLPGLAHCVSIAHSQLVASAFRAAGYRARHVNGDAPADERREAVAALAAGDLDLLTNCGLFSEGVDVSALGCVLLLRPTQSLALYLQMVGLREHDLPGDCRQRDRSGTNSRELAAAAQEARQQAQPERKRRLSPGGPRTRRRNEGCFGRNLASRLIPNCRSSSRVSRLRIGSRGLTENIPQPRRMKLLAFRPLVRNTLRGFCEIELPNGLKISEVSIHFRNGKSWAGLPARPVIDGEGRHHTVDGKRQYSALLEWRSREISDEFSRRVIDLVCAQYPGALDGEGGP